MNVDGPSVQEKSGDVPVTAKGQGSPSPVPSPDMSRGNVQALHPGDRGEAARLVEAEIAELRNALTEATERAESHSRTIETLETRIKELQRETENLAAARDEKQHALDHAILLNAQLQTEVSEMFVSTSWRVTSPLRLVSRGGRLCARSCARALRSVRRRTRSTARSIVLWGMRQILNRPKLRARTAQLLSQFPAVESRVREVGEEAALIGHRTQTIHPEGLSPRATRLYKRLISLSDDKNA